MLWNSINRRGLLETVNSAVVERIIDQLFDMKYGVDTESWSKLDKLDIDSVNKKYGVMYKPSKVRALRKLFSNIKPIIQQNSVFVDLGCGKGRTLLIASEFGFKAVRGVEFAHELCEIARRNFSVYKKKKILKPNFKL